MYDTEEEQVEALKRWWQENGTSAIVGLVVGIVVIVGWNYWQDHKKAQAAEASAAYGQLLKALDEDKKDNVNKLTGHIQEQFKGSEYATYSGLMQAKLKAEQGDFDGAKQILKTIA
ncbi:MAG: tetratricopeptide repeat protein, partial [Methylobacter sp.]|nr:tetratricopeptide repeat protein [Methylobacter sp.]